MHVLPPPEDGGPVEQVEDQEEDGEQAEEDQVRLSQHLHLTMR